MRKRKTTTNSSNQMRWVILLLAIAVILPTVCLLYFMTQAAKNDQLAFRQKLANTYTERIERFFSGNFNLYWKDYKKIIEKDEPVTPNKIGLFTSTTKNSPFSGIVVYDPNDNLLWPVVGNDESLPPENDSEFQNAERLEFQDKNIKAALKEYETISQKYKGDTLWSLERVQANISAARCYKKLGDLKKAIQLLSSVAYSHYEKNDLEAGNLVSLAKVFLAKLYVESDQEMSSERIIPLIGSFYFDKHPCATEIKLFTLRNLLYIARNSDMSEEIKQSLEMYDTVIACLDFSLANYLETEPVRKTSETIVRLNTKKPVYGINFEIQQNKVIALIHGNNLKEFWNSTVKNIEDEIVFCRIYDDRGNFVAGTPKQIRRVEATTGSKFLTSECGKYFDSWKAEFYFRSGIFSDAQKRRRVVYLWTATLVILLILTVSFLAGKAILKQAKLNTLKNDFIATVTHELKTPLASMRVLVDTLLEGSYSDRKQAVEYLQLISRENKRLTGLIDNFLTFSRMERNKQAFEMSDCPAGEIVNDAAAAVRTKFDTENCRFSVTIGENIESVYTDKDAMVTVLVNLLDNAYKYSGDEKEIGLSVYKDNDSVCFAVKDNGIGMSPRVQKKVFERFYQADSKLSRTAEGCGLGLSIVKFIVDAHNGTIDIKSEPDKGTTFTVRIPL